MPTRPNVLIMMTDQQKGTLGHLYGSTFCETPSLERLANEGTLFENRPACKMLADSDTEKRLTRGRMSFAPWYKRTGSGNPWQEDAGL